MNENIPLHVPRSSIIYFAEAQLKQLRLAATGDEIVSLASHLHTSREALDKEIAAVDPKTRKNKQNGNFRCKKLERHVYTALLLFAGYCCLKNKSPLTMQDAQDWLQKIDTYVSGLRYDNKLFLVEQLFYPKIKVFLRALKSHILTRANAEPAVIMLSVFQFSAEMHAYIQTAKKIHAQQIPATTRMIDDALLLFSNAEKQDDDSQWNYHICTTAEHVFGYIMVREEFSDENRAAIERFKKSFIGNGPTTATEEHVVELMDKDASSSLLGVSSLRYSKVHDDTNRFLQLVCEYNLVARFSTEKEQEKEAQALIPALRAFVSHVQHEPKLYVFSRTMLTHTLILAKSPSTHIMSSAIQLFCDVQQTELTHMATTDQWNDCVTEIMSRSVLYIMKSPQFSKEDKTFIQKPSPAQLAPELLKFDFPAFAQRIRRAIAITLLTSNTEMDKAIEKDALLIGQLKFISLCIADEAVSKVLKEFSALLNTYRYFTGSMSLSFLDGPTDVRFTEAMHIVETSDVSRPYLIDMTRHFSALNDFSVMATFFLFCKKALQQGDPALKDDVENILLAYAHNTIIFLCKIEINRIKEAVLTRHVAALTQEYETRRENCSTIERHIYSTLRLYSLYLSIDLKSNTTVWIEHSQDVIRQLQSDDKTLSHIDKILTRKLYMFALVLSAHAHAIIENRLPTVKSATLHVLCELENARNPVISGHPSQAAFFAKAIASFKCWTVGTANVLDALLDNLCSKKTDKEFFGYCKKGEANPESFLSTSTLLTSDYASFARSIEIEIARVLLSPTPKTKMNPSIEEKMFLFGQLLFLKLQLKQSDPKSEMYGEIQKRLDAVLPLLHLYRYFLQSPPCYIDIEKQPDVEDNFAQLCLVLKKTKTPSLLDESLHVLSVLFTPSQKSVQLVKNYLISAEKIKWRFNNFQLTSAFFLICKKALALKNPELTSLVEKNLRGFQGTQTVKREITVEKQVALINSSTAKKKKKGNKSKKKDKKPPETRAEGAPTKERVEVKTEAWMSVVSVETVVSPAPVVVETSTAEGCSEPEPAPDSLLAYLLRTGCRREKLEEPSAEQNVIFTLKTRLTDFFNSKAHAQNQFKYTLGGYGSQQLRQKFFAYPIFINDLDFVINCNFNELQELLETHRTELNIAQILPLPQLKHPIIIISFQEDPHFYVDITPLHRLTTPLKWSLFRVFKEKQATLDFPPNAIFSVIVDGWEFFVDTQQGLDVLEKGPRELRLISTAHPPDEIAQMILRSIKFLAKCPDFTPSRELLDWFAENQGTLSTYAALNPFAKLLFSGVAMRSLALLNEFGLLKSLFPILIPLMHKEEFTTWVKAFDTYESPGYKLEARKNYRETFCRVLAEFFYLTRDTISLKRLPHEIPRLDRKTIKSRWEEKKKYERLEFFPSAPEDVSPPGQQGESCYTAPTTNMRSSKNGDGN